MGEKGRAQLGRYERDSIYSTIADTNKVAITFSQACSPSEAVCSTCLSLERLVAQPAKLSTATPAN